MLAWKTLTKNTGELVVARINSTVLSAKRRSTKQTSDATIITKCERSGMITICMHDMAICGALSNLIGIGFRTFIM